MNRLLAILICSILTAMIVESPNHSVSFQRFSKEDLLFENQLSIQVLGIDISNHSLKYEEDIAYDMQHYIVSQKIEGIPVFGRSARIHFNNRSDYASVSIDFFEGDRDSPSETLNESAALLIARQDFNVINASFRKVEKKYYIQDNYAYLCYFIDAVAYDQAYTYVISAVTGQILNRFSLIQTDGPVVGSGENLLGEWVEELQIYEGSSFLGMGDLVTPYLVCEAYCWDYGDCEWNENINGCTLSYSQGSCPDGYLEDCNGDCFNEWYMEFPGVGNGFCNEPWINIQEDGVLVGPYNLIDQSAPNLGMIFTINSYGGFYSDLSYVNHTSEVFDSQEISHSHASGVSAHDYQRKTLDYMWERHGYAGIDGEGKRTVSVINYGSGGGISQNNAFFNAGLDALSYGIAGGSYRPFCAAQDIVTHEFTHGFTAHTSGLVYQNQPGALNESMSDVFGYLVEAEYQDGGDWTEGEDIRINGGASRSFSHPPTYGDPDNINHPYFVPYASNPNMFNNDFGGVHSNSGIPNKVLYLVVQGDTHYGINVEPFEEDINQSRYVASDVWYNWNRYYLGPEDDFIIGREKMLQTAIDLWPNNYRYYHTIANAWASVGVGDPILAGDINEDMIVNIQDIVIMVGAVIENITLTQEQVVAGDLNYDGIVDVLDIVLAINIIFSE